MTGASCQLMGTWGQEQIRLGQSFIPQQFSGHCGERDTSPWRQVALGPNASSATHQPGSLGQLF